MPAIRSSSRCTGSKVGGRSRRRLAPAPSRNTHRRASGWSRRPRRPDSGTSRPARRRQARWWIRHRCAGRPPACGRRGQSSGRDARRPRRSDSSASPREAAWPGGSSGWCATTLRQIAAWAPALQSHEARWWWVGDALSVIAGLQSVSKLPIGGTIAC